MTLDTGDAPGTAAPDPPPSTAPSAGSGWVGEGLILMAILLVAAHLRLTGLAWGGNLYLHPDERFQTMVVTRIAWPDGLGAYFDSRTSPLNPYNQEFGTYIYGNAPLFLAKLAGSLSGHTVYGDAHLPGRALATAFDLLGIVVVALVGRRLFDRRVGLLAAALLATTVLHIQSSHFFTPDTATAALALVTFALALQARGGGWRWCALAGVAAGLTIASRINALPVLAFLSLPMLETLRRRAGPLGTRPPGEVRRAALGLTIAVLAAVWTFRLAQPYAVLGPSPLSFRLDPRWLADLRFWREVQSGSVDTPPAIQWANRTPILFSLRNLVLWGMGPPLGVAALLGLGLGVVGAVSRRRLPRITMLMLLGWPLFHVLLYGGGFVQTQRYLLPAYPFLILLAAAVLVSVVDHGRARGWGSIPILRPPGGNALRLPVGALPAAIVLTGSLLYAVGFTDIYQRPTTRETASRWIYANVPAGSTIASEHWDDGLPVALVGQDQRDYRAVQLELFFPDDEAKLSTLLGQLDRIDYLVLSSNRLSATIPRMPERYPMTATYYEMLLGGRLGFDLVHVERSFPSYLGVALDDTEAEEAFTVYDHPTVHIFRRSDTYARAPVEAALTAALSPGAYPIDPIDAGRNLLLMDDATRAQQQASGTWSRMFDPASLTNRWPILAWLAALQVMSLAAIPLCWRVLTGLPDRGYAVSKTIGLLAVSYVAWLLASLGILSFGPNAVVAGLLVTAGISALAVRGKGPRLRADLRARWRGVLATEVVYLAAFGGMLLVRAQNPDLWHRYRGGEKPMDLAYLNAVLRSTSFPPYDPWFAGGQLNYYYFGFVQWAVPTRLTGIVPEVAYNLAVASIFALLCVNVWSLAAAAATRWTSVISEETGRRIAAHAWRPLLVALPAPILVAGLGNLDLAPRIGRGELGYPPDPLGLDRFPLGWPGDLLGGLWSVVRHRPDLPDDAYWGSTRIIAGTINEFPLFSFLLGDLHAHVMALPLASAALLLAVHQLAPSVGNQPVDDPPDHAPATKSPLSSDGSVGWAARGARWLSDRAAGRGLPTMGLAALVLGAIFATNSWDYPTYLVIIGAAFTLRSGQAAGWRLTYRRAVATALWLAALAFLSRLLFWPFVSSFHTGHLSPSPLAGGTPVADYLTIHGLFLAVIGTVLLLQWPSRGARFPRHPGWATHWPLVPFGVALAAGIVVDRLDLVLVSLLTLAVLAAWQRRSSPDRQAMPLLAASGLALSLVVEHVVVGGDIGRMNTVFKTYLQIWLVLGVAAAIGVAWVTSTWRPGGTRRSLAQAMAVGIVLLLTAGATVYPLVAIRARSQDRFAELPATLDGMAYLTRAVYTDAPEGRPPVEFSLVGDARAIAWLRATVQGSPVILEATIPGYRWGSRVSVYTGLPTVLGWDWHQTQQRPGFGAMVVERRADVARMLGEATGFEEVQPLLDRYHVRLIYIGALERAYYPATALAKFDEAAARGLLTVVYQGDEVTIYTYDG